jgi:epoxide hydrolase 4
MSQPALEQQRIKTNGVWLNVVRAGNADGKVTLLLHGFPEFWQAWQKQIGALVAAGYRVWIPDQRGYNMSEKPRGLAAYAVDVLVEDIRGLIESETREPVHLIGHDWGGAIAWRLVNRYPHLVERLVIVNAAHFAVMQQELRSNFRQLLRSWYIFLFQIPKLPEYLLSRNDYRVLVKALCSRSRKGSFSEREIESYREAWKQPGALTAMLNWYRAAVQEATKAVETPRIEVPTLLIWGAKDHALGPELAQPSIDLCDSGRLVFIEGAGHWVLHEEPETVNKLLLEFLATEPRLALNRTRDSGAPVS